MEKASQQREVIEGKPPLPILSQKQTCTVILRQENSMHLHRQLLYLTVLIPSNATRLLK